MAQQPVSAADRQEAQAALDKTRGNISQAARLLGIPRETLRGRLRAVERASPDEEAPAPIVDEKIELKDQIRALRAQIEGHRRETLDERYVKEVILKMADLEPVVPKWLLSPGRQSAKSPGVPTLFASDWHWGEVVDPTQIGHVNEFDMETAQRRARRMIEITIDLLNNHMVNPEYPGIIFALGGDMVSGDIHEELLATNEKEIMPVVLDMFGVLIWCIARLADEFGRVFVPCVGGNHGRNTHKIRAKGRNHTSFDWLLYQFLAKHFTNDKRVQFFIPNGPDALYSVYGHRYLLTHGDQFRGGDGMIGALGPIIRGDHKKRSRNAQIDMEYDTMLLGHWHQLIQLKRLIVNGSLKGYDEYAYSNSFGFEPPQQALWITHPQHGITFSMPVKLDEPAAAPLGGWVSWKD